MIYIWTQRVTTRYGPPWQWPLVTLSDLQRQGHWILCPKIWFCQKYTKKQVWYLFSMWFWFKNSFLTIFPGYFWLILQGHLQGQKINFKVKSAKIWLSTETIIATSVIRHFDVFLLEKNLYGVFLIIQGHHQNQRPSQKVNLKVESAKNMIFHKYNYRYKCNTSFWCVLTRETIYVIVL